MRCVWWFHEGRWLMTNSNERMKWINEWNEWTKTQLRLYKWLLRGRMTQWRVTWLLHWNSTDNHITALHITHHTRLCLGSITILFCNYNLSPLQFQTRDNIMRRFTFTLTMMRFHWFIAIWSKSPFDMIILTLFGINAVKCQGKFVSREKFPIKRWFS